ncbi:hypothetical protein [Agromyces sp. PvR057]|uniref:hypothetical protein n=1 Tax=Agromyces sp. PvR057 TaxID=3156403 RepID=UPI003390EF69
MAVLIIVLLLVSLVLTGVGTWYTTRPMLVEVEPQYYSFPNPKDWKVRNLGMLLLGSGLLTSTIASLLGVLEAL